MKHVNFINTVPPATQRSIRQWYHITWFLVCVVCIGMISMHISQWYTWRMLKNQCVCCERTPDTALQEAVRQLQERETLLKQYVHQIEQNKMNLSAWHNRITQLFGSGFTIQSCDMNERDATLIIHVASLDHAKEAINRLQGCSSIKSVNLLSLQPMSGNGGYACSCKVSYSLSDNSSK